MKQPTKSNTPLKSAAPSKSAGTKSASSGRSGSSTVIASKGSAASKTAAGSSSRGKSAAGQGSHKDSLEKIMKDMLKDIYYAEKQLQKALGKMAKSASNQELSEAFLTHQRQTAVQIEKLNGVFEGFGMKPQAKRCAAMDGLLEEGNEQIEEYGKGPGRDAAMIVSAQKCEHYEIAAYGSMRTFASTLGFNDASQVFEEILQEENDTDELLTTIANSVNEDAVAGSDEEEG